MRVLLIEAPYDYKISKIAVDQYFPLGLGYIAAVLKQAGEEVELLVSSPGCDFSQLLTSRLERFVPELVGISCMTPSFPTAIEIARAVKEQTNAKVVLGGHHATALGEEILQRYPEIDFVVYGEGESTMLDLCQKLGQGDYEDIPGLMWREDALIHRNMPRPLIKDIDRLPFPARELVDMSAFGVHGHIKIGGRSATMITSRGCPYQCVFCSSRLTMGRSYRAHSPEYVVEEMELLAQKYQVDYIVIEDDTFTVLPERTHEICERLIERNLGIQWYCLSRVDKMDVSLAQKMKRAGCRMIAFGVESGDQEVLNRIGKRTSLEDAREAIKICKEAGLRTQATFVIGFPFDDLETIGRTLDFACELSPTVAIIFPLTPYPGAECFSYLSESQRPKALEDWKRFTMAIQEPPVSFIDGLSPRDLQRLANREHLRFYLRPKQLYEMLRTVRSAGELVGYLNSALAFAMRYFDSR